MHLVQILLWLLQWAIPEANQIGEEVPHLQEIYQ